MAYSIRTYGDPVLKTKAAPITDVDGKLVRLVDEMFTTLLDSDLGIALAAPQIGVQKQVFVWDLDDEQQVIFNPEIVESDGECVYDVCGRSTSTPGRCPRRPRMRRATA